MQSEGEAFRSCVLGGVNRCVKTVGGDVHDNVEY